MTEELDRLRQYLPFTLEYTAQKASSVMTADLARAIGLRPQAMHLLAVIKDDGLCTQTQLCRRSGYDKMTVSRFMKYLLERDLVIRTASRDDGRSSVIGLTVRGNETVEQMIEIMQAQQVVMFSQFTTAEIETFQRLLHRLRTTADNVERGALHFRTKEQRRANFVSMVRPDAKLPVAS